MTLYRQLIIAITLIFLMIFSGVFWISVTNTRDFLQLQMTTQTQNAVDSLGLSLAPHLERHDLAAADTMINALFDSGYYQSLELNALDGKPLITRRNTRQIDGVPTWFIGSLPMPAPVVESVITSGWRQSGHLKLQAHPGFAYKTLWDTAAEMFWWSLLAFALALIAALLLIKALLRPLEAVEQQALAISEHEFPILETLPRTRELKRVVVAMNAMSAKIKGYLDMLSERAEQLRRQTIIDPLTGLTNRRGFNARFEYLLQDKERGGSGLLAVIRLSDLAALNRERGHEAVNGLLIAMADAIGKTAGHYDHAMAARLTGGEFALLLPGVGIDLAGELQEELHRLLEAVASQQQLEQVAHVGIACFDCHAQGVTLAAGEVLSAVDAALSEAVQQGANACVIAGDAAGPLGNEAWRALIEQSMHAHRIELCGQDVGGENGSVIYRELLMRIPDDAGGYYSPATFTAMAERLGLHGELDRYVIERGIAYLQAHTDEQLGINISPHSLAEDAFLSWLADCFAQHKALFARLCFELPEYGVLQHADAAGVFNEQVHAFGAAVTLEHFGSHLSSFELLQRLKFDYVKVDGRFTCNIDEQPDQQFFLRTLSDIAHGLEAQVIAEHVENESEAACLKQLGVDAMQGYLIGAPQPLAK